MADYIFKLPDLGEGTVESEIVEWRVKPGDAIEAEQPLVDMMTDKATVEITSPVSGTVVSLAGNPGDMIPVGAELAVFNTGNGTVPPQTTAAQKTEVTAPAQAQKPSAAKPGPRPQTSPAIRRRARESGVDLNDVAGTGRSGRITQADLDAFLDAEHADAPKPAPLTTRVALDDVAEIPLMGLRRKIAEKMALSKRHIPHFGYVEEVDVTELDALRKHLNDTRAADQPKLTFLPFFVQALVRVLEDFPQCNAHFDEERAVVRRYAAAHVGIATQTDGGLMVAVVRNTQNLDLWECMTEMQRVTGAARAGKATREELTGSTITITSLGPLGGIATAPVINHPEVAIIGINKVQERPVVRNGLIVPRLMMNLSSAFDHRVVDGYDAARMIQAMKAILEHPATLFI